MSTTQEALSGPVPDVRVLITAEEAYPEMERAFLEAKHHIWAGYRVFDLSTRLRSPEGKRIGEDWFDLVVHVLKKGVSITMILSDFDPIFGNTLHCETWKAKRAFVAAGEVAGPGAPLKVLAATHSARIGWLPRLVLWPRSHKKLADHADRLNRMAPKVREGILRCSPGLRRWLVEQADGSLRALRWPVPELMPSTHHQKLAVFDGSLLCIGGLDLDERRYDDKGHHRSRDETWHDVQIMTKGPVAEDAQRHLETFLDVVKGNTDPPPPGRLLTTLSSRRRFSLPYLSPRPVNQSIADTHHHLIPKARRLIYLETQFFRDVRLARALAQAADANPDLTMILVVPAAPEDVAFGNVTSADARYGEYLQAKSINIIGKAFGDRLTVCCPVRPATAQSDKRDTFLGSPIVYVHAKVSIFDEDRAIVSSANLNGRSLYWDTEAGVMLEDEPCVQDLKRQMICHWQGGDAGPEFHDPASAAAVWMQRAKANVDCAPEDRRGFLVPYDPGPAERFGRPLPFVPPEMV